MKESQVEFTCTFKLVDFGALKALATIQIGDMEIKGFKIVESGVKTWVALPSREITKNGKKEYFDVVRFKDPKKREEFEKRVLADYAKEVNNAGSD